MASLPSQYSISAHKCCTLPRNHSNNKSFPRRRLYRLYHSATATISASSASTPATERDEWVSSVRNTTGRVKHRLWAPHVSLDPPPLLADVAVVLVSPKRPTSVGSVARALSCFECVDLRIVNPRCDPLARSARNGSKGAQYLLWRATTHETLEDALDGATASVAFTRWLNGLHGVPSYRSMKTFLDSPEIQLIHNVNNHEKHQQQQQEQDSISDEATSKNKLVLVFGREEEGLRPEEVTACSAACSIPIGRLQESLSLSHAVSLVLAPLFEYRQESLLLERGGGDGELVETKNDLAVGVETHDD